MIIAFYILAGITLSGIVLTLLGIVVILKYQVKEARNLKKTLYTATRLQNTKFGELESQINILHLLLMFEDEEDETVQELVKEKPIEAYINYLNLASDRFTTSDAQRRSISAIIKNIKNNYYERQQEQNSKSKSGAGK